MLCLKVHHRDDKPYVYALQGKLMPRRLAYVSGTAGHELHDRVEEMAEEVRDKLGKDMTYQPLWRVPCEKHDELVDKLMVPLPHQDDDYKRMIEVVPKHVLTMLQADNGRAVPVQHRVKPALWEQLKPFQKEGVLFAISNHGGRAIIADDMGLGKTMQGLGFMSHFAEEGAAVIICPAAVMPSWKYHVRTYLGDVNVITSWESDFVEDGVNLMSYGMFTSKKFDAKVKAFKPKVMVVDESHYIKSSEAGRTKKVFKWSRTAKHVLLLTGTPSNRPVELYSQIKCIKRDLFPIFFHYQVHTPATGIVTSQSNVARSNMFYFASRYTKPERKMVRGSWAWLFKGSENESELHALLKRHIMIRRLKADVLPQLPDKIRERVVIDEFKQDVPLEFSSDTEFMELVRETAAKKAEHVQDYLKDILCKELANDPELKVLVWAHHHFMLDGIRETLDKERIRYVCMDGRTSVKARGERVKEFQEDDSIRVAILGISAMATGVTLTAATLSIFTELAFTPDVHLQAEDRCHRMGQVNPVCIRYLIAEGSTDTLVWNLITTKHTSSAIVADGHERYMTTQKKRTSREKDLLVKKAKFSLVP